MNNLNRTIILTAGLALLVIQSATVQAQSFGITYQDKNWGINYYSGAPLVAPPPVVVPQSVYARPRMRPVYWRPRFPVHPPNPVVDQRVTQNAGVSYDGTHHSERLVENYHASAFNPGRDVPITRPMTSTSTQYTPNGVVTRKHTSWIGADRQPHTETITEHTSYDRWGNSHTETRVRATGQPEEPNTAGTAGTAGATIQESTRRNN